MSSNLNSSITTRLWLSQLPPDLARWVPHMVTEKPAPPAQISQEQIDRLFEEFEAENRIHDSRRGVKPTGPAIFRANAEVVDNSNSDNRVHTVTGAGSGAANGPSSLQVLNGLKRSDATYRVEEDD